MEDHEPIRAQPDLIEQTTDVVEPPATSAVALEVMAVAFLAADDADGIRAILESLEEMLWLKATRTGHNHLSDGKGPGKIGRSRAAADPGTRNKSRPGAVFADERDQDTISARAVSRAHIPIAGRSGSSPGITHG
jgi:hypothetical protein